MFRSKLILIKNLTVVSTKGPMQSFNKMPVNVQSPYGANPSPASVYGSNAPREPSYQQGNAYPQPTYGAQSKIPAGYQGGVKHETDYRQVWLFFENVICKSSHSCL